MIINRKKMASIMTKIVHIIVITLKGINHDSTVVVTKLFGDVNNVEFIFDKMKR
jgi:hypothetical protein